MIVPDEVCEVAPVVWVYVLHVPLEVLPAHLHLPLQARLVAELPGPRCGGLHAECVGSWGDPKDGINKERSINWSRSLPRVYYIGRRGLKWSVTLKKKKNWSIHGFCDMQSCIIHEL